MTEADTPLCRSSALTIWIQEKEWCHPSAPMMSSQCSFFCHPSS
ncbi:hypothetical protein OZD63_05105 [Wolbachia endosymbiont of Drosophila leontia]|nr:hypothetical protein [Wolbachia endosymbiont of Drosophila leontia]MDE5067434.1 hypothetical protein [Wolbachia endosymbiont of Drosophila leontia]